MWEKFGLEIVQMLLPVIAALLMALIGYGVAFLKAKTNALNEGVAKQSILAAINEAERVAKNAVMAVKQTLVDDLKKAAEDGQLTDQEKQAALNKAKNIFVATISKNSLGILEAAIGPVQNWLDQLLEAKLAEFKGGSAAQIYQYSHPL
jgi:hypothetical protein